MGRVVLITLDTTRADRLGCYGYEGARTPNLDRLAREGVLFEQAVSPIACTLPSHSTMFTGLYPPATGVRYNTIFKLDEKFETLAERFRDRGFETAAFVSSFPLDPSFGLDQGFDLYDSPQLDGPTDSRIKAVRSADVVIARAVQWMSSRAGSRYFVWIHVWDPHWPYTPPFPFSSEFRDEPYDGEIAFADAELGGLFEAIENGGRWEDTLIIVAGDHGEGLYDHNEGQHSMLAYETTLRVPLIVKAPGGARGHRVDRAVTIADIAPTIADLVGLREAPADGISLRAALEGGNSPERDLYFEALAGSIVHGWSSIEGVRSGSLKYLDSVAPELFDLSVDPGETENLVDLEPKTAERLAIALERLKEDITQLVMDPAEASAPVLDPDLQARLAALGYVGGSEAGTASKEGPSPRDLIYLEGELGTLQMLALEDRWDDVVETGGYILEKNPTNRFTMFVLAHALANLERWHEALVAVDSLLAVYDDSASFYDLRGQILVSLGETTAAAEVFAEARARFPETESLAYHHVVALLEAGSTDAGCHKALPDALATVPNRSRLFVLEARCRLLDDDPDGALQSLQAAVEAGFRDLEGLAKIPDFRELAGRPEFPTLEDVSGS